MLTRTVVVALLLGACAHPAVDGQRGAEKAPGAARRTLGAPAPMPTPATSEETAKVTSTSVDFTRDVRPILESRCQPCHFAGGRVYERLPFDRPQTIRQLGTKLFTRIKDEPSQATIREFLADNR